jgi:beta-glucosidase
MTNRTYRYDPRKPLFPFGFGLSYSKFTYGEWQGPKQISIGKDLVGRVRVKNVSSRDGEEVVEFYLTHPGKDAAIRELRWFKRVMIPAGKSQWVDIRIPAKHLAVHDQQGNLVLAPAKSSASIGGGQPGTPGIASPINVTFELIGSTKIWK